MRGEFGLRKYDTKTGKLIEEVKPTSNNITTAGLNALASRQANSGLPWNVANMHLQIDVSAGTTPTLADSTVTGGQSTTTVTSVISGQGLRITWRDEATTIYTPSEVHIRTTSGGSDLVD